MDNYVRNLHRLAHKRATYRAQVLEAELQGIDVELQAGHLLALCKDLAGQTGALRKGRQYTSSWSDLKLSYDTATVRGPVN